MLRNVLILACGFLLSTTAQAGAREQLAAFTQGIQGLQSRFEQRVYDGNGRQTETSSGVVMLKVPRQFRWEYQQPFPQLIVADGDQIWIYDPDLEQVTVRKQSYEEQSSPLAVLIDPGELDRQFRTREAGREGELEWLELLPKKPDDAPFEKARLAFGANGLAQMELFDGLGQRTVLSFADWQRDPSFAGDAFRFVPPPGVEVVGDLVEHAEVTPLRDE